MRSIFVFGLFPISPGKTVVSKALCRGILNKGLNVAPFKPRSGHNLWYQYDTFVKCKKEDRLICEDIIKLKEASRCHLPYEILNPVDALMAPLEAKRFLKENYMRGMYLKEDNIFSHLLVERYTSCEDRKAKSIICVNEANLSGEVLIDREYIKALIERADEVIAVKNLDEWNSVFKTFGPLSISTCSSRIAEEYELMVVEGFNDAVCPAPELSYDAVVGVGPGVAAIYDPVDFEKVIEVKSMISGEPMALRSRDIVEFIKPEKILTVPALLNKDLIDLDRLSEKLGEIVDVVIG